MLHLPPLGKSGSSGGGAGDHIGTETPWTSTSFSFVMDGIERGQIESMECTPQEIAAIENILSQSGMVAGSGGTAGTTACQHCGRIFVSKYINGHQGMPVRRVQ